jgi:hypothetical protein
MYIFAKFVPEHIFLQNRDKLNIKNSCCCRPPRQARWQPTTPPSPGAPIKSVLMAGHPPRQACFSYGKMQGNFFIFILS